MSDERIKEAFNAFTGGVRPSYTPLPTWDTAPSWVRDAMRVAYLQGKLDSALSSSDRANNSEQERQ